MGSASLFAGGANDGTVDISLLVGVVFYVLFVIGYWKSFVKAGEPGWKAIIPVYNLYVAMKLYWKENMYWPLMLSGVAMGLIDSASQSSQSLLLSLGYIVLGIVFIVLDVRLSIFTAKSYGFGTGFGVLMFFFPYICTIIIGFGKSVYIGPAGNPGGAGTVL